MENEGFFVWVRTKENKRFVMCAAGIFAMTVLSSYIYGRTAILRYESWTAFAENVPCGRLEQVDQNIQVTRPLVINSENFGWHYPVPDKNLVKVIDERCHLNAPGG
jgi:hypothetical protein